MKVPPALVLFFLAPAIGELLSGSAPPAEFFNPISLLLLSSLYGSGALLVRELKIRWNKSYVSLFILGAAYGVIEEGLMVKSFFDPGWMDLGTLGVYGRWMEVNWVWAEWLTIYHAIFSIAIPIALVEVAYPDLRNERWLSNRKLAATTVLLCAVTAFGYGFLTTYRPPLLQYLTSAVLVGALFVLARKTPHKTGKNGSLNPSKPLKLALLGFFTTLSLFLLFGAGPTVIGSPAVLMLLGIALVFAIFCLLKRYEWDERRLYHKFALAAGALGFFIAIAPLQELDKSRLDNTQGMLFVGIAAAILLILVRKKLKSYLASLTNIEK
jgi:FtsH-binding integral membrane protein